MVGLPRSQFQAIGLSNQGIQSNYAERKSKSDSPLTGRRKGTTKGRRKGKGGKGVFTRLIIHNNVRRVAYGRTYELR